MELDKDVMVTTNDAMSRSFTPVVACGERDGREGLGCESVGFHGSGKCVHPSLVVLTSLYTEYVFHTSRDV